MATATKRESEVAVDLEIETAVRCAAMALEALPEEKRLIAAAKLAQRVAPPRHPQRGGPVLKNVVALFKETKRTDWSADDVVSALGSFEPKKVYSALTYLKDMKIIHRVGYGRYRLANGGLLITHERGGE